MISIIIPCYKSSKNINNVIDEITETMKDNNEKEYEIILVNDCSPDNTFETLKDIAKNNRLVTVIDLSKNQGQASAIMCGLRFAKGDYIVSGDDDGQTPFCDLFKLKDKLDKENLDIVCGKYVTRDRNSIFRSFGSKINEKMSEHILEQPKGLYMSAFFVAKRYVVEEMIKYKNPYPYISGLILRTTSRIGNVDVPQRKRLSGKSGYSFIKLLALWVNGFTAFSIKPLRVSSFIGVFCAIVGFTFGIITIIRKLCIPAISVGWSSTVAIMLFIGGLIMLMLGMIGEYIGRIYISINNSPQYVVRETINVKEEK